MRDYELVLIVHPEIQEEAMTGVTEKVGGWITNAGGEVTNVTPWGRKRLAYPIKKQRDGTFMLMNLRVKPAATAELERNLKLTDQVLRHMLIRMGD